MKLTEDIVMQRLRNCSSPLDGITKINITGRDLDDISLLRKMTSIEVLSLSVNKISTLRDLQFCKCLKELYIRKNNIRDINEIYYIMDLPLLTTLGLSQNPCSNFPNYRMTIIRNLHKLEKLDDIPILPEERVEALKKGNKIVNPEEGIQEDEEDVIGLVSDRGTLKGVEDKPPCDDIAPLPAEARLDELDMTNSHHSSKSRFPSRAVSQSLRMDACSPERGYLEVSTVDKPKSVPGIAHSNLLPGILVLVTDLDYYSLEILSLNIKNRLNEFQTNALPKK